MHNLVTEDADEECADGDNQDTSPARNIVVDGMDKLRADNAVHGRPSNTGKDIEHSNCSLESALATSNRNNARLHLHVGETG